MASFPLPIRFNDIVFYIEYYEVDDPQRFVLLIQAMDSSYIQHQVEKQKVKTSSANNANGGRTERFHG